MEAREIYIEFLALELLVMNKATSGEQDPELLSRFNALLEERFPKTLRYMEENLNRNGERPAVENIKTVAWAEARSFGEDGGTGKVSGRWTASEITADINDCLREAVKRAGLA